MSWDDQLPSTREVEQLRKELHAHNRRYYVMLSPSFPIVILTA